MTNHEYSERVRKIIIERKGVCQADWDDMKEEVELNAIIASNIFAKISPSHCAQEICTAYDIE